MSSDPEPASLAQSSNGRISGRPWKAHKSPTVRVPLTNGVKPKSWRDRMEKTNKAQAVKKLLQELKDEKQTELQKRREVTLERKKAAEEKRKLEEATAKMGARRAARLRRKAGRTKKVNH